MKTDDERNVSPGSAVIKPSTGGAGQASGGDPAMRVQELSDDLARVSLERLQENSRHKKWEGILKNSLRRQRKLSTHLMSIREEELTNVSREIHEDLGQLLAALQLNVSLMTFEFHDHELLVARAKVLEQLIASSIKKVQRISSDLRPVMLDLLGLADAIEWQAEEFQKNSGIPCKTIVLLTEKKVGRDVSTAVFRIFQEAMANVIRHSGATRVHVGLVERKGRLTLTVRDNGRGITEQQKKELLSLGIAKMREWAEAFGGKLKICGSPGLGTILLARISLAGKEELHDYQNTDCR